MRATNSTAFKTGMSQTIANPCAPWGPGVKEIRIRDSDAAFRIIYVAKFADAIYVLHCFQKKTQKTSQADRDLAVRRYRDLLKELER